MFQIDRLPQTDDELYYIVQALWGVTIPRHKVCENHVAPFTAFADAYFARNSLNPELGVKSIALWHGSRGLSGKSFMLSILGLTEAFLLGTKINLLGGSLSQSQTIHEHMREALYSKHSPRYLIEHEGTSMIRLSNGAKIKPLTASQRTVRGPHPSRILLDEIDEMEMSILDAALGQPMHQVSYTGEMIEPFTVMCSTWQNPDGTFTEIMKRAEEKGIPVYQWCFLDTANPIDGWLTQAAIDEKKASIPAEMWRVEYELGEPSIGNRAFDTEKVEKTFAYDPSVISKKIYRDFEEFVFEEYDPDYKYVAGADWAKEHDYTVISVARVDGDERTVVYFMRINRQPYPVMIRHFERAIHRYHAMAQHDATSMGNVIHDLMEEMGVTSRKFVMAGQKRADMLTEFVAVVENLQWHIPKALRSAYSEMKYARVGDLYSTSQDYHLPDTVCAFALCEHLAKRMWTASSPVVVGKDAANINRYQKMFEPHIQYIEENTERTEGQVLVREPEHNPYSLMA